MIVENQQKRDPNIENYIKQSICGYDGPDPKVCCASVAVLNTAPTSTSLQPQPAPFVFSSVNAQSNPATSPPSISGQPTFSPITPVNTGNNGNPTNPNQPTPGTVIFSPVGTTAPPLTQTTLPISTTPGLLLNRLPTFEQDKCGLNYAVRSRIVG